MADPKGFLQSCRVECANLPSHMAAVTFLVRMTLQNLIELDRCVRLQDRNGHFYDARKDPYCGCGHGRYGVGDVYRLCGSAWQDTVLKIAPPKNIAVLEARGA